MHGRPIELPLTARYEPREAKKGVAATFEYPSQMKPTGFAIERDTSFLHVIKDQGEPSAQVPLQMMTLRVSQSPELRGLGTRLSDVDDLILGQKSALEGDVEFVEGRLEHSNENEALHARYTLVDGLETMHEGTEVSEKTVVHLYWPVENGARVLKYRIEIDTTIRGCHPMRRPLISAVLHSFEPR